MPPWRAGRNCCWSTNWPTPTPKARGTPSAGRTCEELLDAGIDVWTTLNVQHIESLNDVIAQITGVVVRERLPDAVLEQADEIELIDITPEELMERLAAGKVYIPQQAERALQNFFHKGNLVALRELSLRQAAHRLHRDVDAARHERAAVAPWLTTERLLVCVGPSPNSARIVRATKRLAIVARRRVAGGGGEHGRRPRVGCDAGANGPQPAAGRTTRRGNAHAGRPQRGRTRCSTTPARATSRRSSSARRRCRAGSAGCSARSSINLLEGGGDIDIYMVSGEGETPQLAASACARGAVSLVGLRLGGGRRRLVRSGGLGGRRRRAGRGQRRDDVLRRRGVRRGATGPRTGDRRQRCQRAWCSISSSCRRG